MPTKYDSKHKHWEARLERRHQGEETLRKGIEAKEKAAAHQKTQEDIGHSRIIMGRPMDTLEIINETTEEVINDTITEVLTEEAVDEIPILENGETIEKVNAALEAEALAKEEAENLKLQLEQEKARHNKELAELRKSVQAIKKQVADKE